AALLDILAITGPIFLIIALGYAIVGLGVFRKPDLRVLGGFVINIALPAVLFKALSQRTFDAVMDVDYLVAYALGSLAVLALGIAAGHFVRRRGLQASALIGMGMGMSNSAFVG